MSDKQTCPNCGNEFVEKTKFRDGITILTPSNEVCCHMASTGVPMLYFHINGGGCVDEMPKSAEEGMTGEEYTEQMRADPDHGGEVGKINSS